MTSYLAEITEDHLPIEVTLTSPEGRLGSVELFLPTGILASLNGRERCLLASSVAVNYTSTDSRTQLSIPPAPVDARARDALAHVMQMAADAALVAGSGLFHANGDEAFSLADTSESAAMASSPPLPVGSERRALLLASGGIDSLVAAHRLQREGMDVALLHVAGVNLDAPNELAGAQCVADTLGLPLHVVEVEWRGLREFVGKRIGAVFDGFPTHNAIPFGRDLLLLALGGIVAKRLGAANVCLAHEHEIWDRPPITALGRMIYRTELASRGAREALNTVLRGFVHPQMNYFSPIADRTKYAVLQEAYQRFGDVLGRLSSCYWGHWCGLCPKCLTYGLLASEYPGIALPFQRDPLTAYGERIDLAEDIEGGPLWPMSRKQMQSAAQIVGPKQTPLGGTLREPLGLANMVVLSGLLEEGRLPRGTAFEQFRAQLYPGVKGQSGVIREFLLRPQVV